MCIRDSYNIIHRYSPYFVVFRRLSLSFGFLNGPLNRHLLQLWFYYPIQSRFAETRFAETLTLNPNFGESGFGESGRHLLSHFGHRCACWGCVNLNLIFDWFIWKIEKIQGAFKILLHCLNSSCTKERVVIFGSMVWFSESVSQLNGVI